MGQLVARFVDSISSNRQIRLNLADGSMWRLLDDSTLDPPQAVRATASTMLTDGNIHPATTYDERTLDLHWLLENISTEQAANQLQDLAQELDRPFNIFEYQPPNATNPVFFRTFRLGLDQIRMVTDGTLHDVHATIQAEPFAYGLLETPISGATLNRDPAAASNPTYVDVTGVKGDVETPALIKLGTGVASRVSLFAVRRRGTPANAPWLFQAESLTQGTDTSTQANDANFSGASNNYSRCSFATVTTMATRLTLSDLGTAGVDLRGRYHVYLRYRKNTSGDSITMQLVWGLSGGVTTTNTLFTTPATTNITTADLGEIQVPRGWDPVYDGRSGVELSVTDVFFAALQIRRVSGSGTIDLDYLRLVPADDRLGTVTFVEPSSDSWWLDSEDNSINARNSSGQLETAAMPTLAGAFPMLSPNVTNRIHMLYEIGSGLATALTTQNVSVNYYPRYLYVRPVST